MQQIDSITAVSDRYDLIVFDQFGVLHNGSAPYPNAVAAITALRKANTRLAVLSNSGKSAALNRDRITSMGFAADAFDIVMTSGEALRLALQDGALAGVRTLNAIEAKPGDAQLWAKGLPTEFVEDPTQADAILLMGIPDAPSHERERALLAQARKAGKLLLCSNPDRKAPRAHGQLVESPGALAHEYAEAGGEVTFYGKPHRPVFDAVLAQAGSIPPDRVLMVGDSPEHDIAGAIGAGWHSLFIQGGIHDRDDPATLFAPNALPDYTMHTLR